MDEFIEYLRDRAELLAQVLVVHRERVTASNLSDDGDEKRLALYYQDLADGEYQAVRASLEDLEAVDSFDYGRLIGVLEDAFLRAESEVERLHTKSTASYQDAIRSGDKGPFDAATRQLNFATGQQTGFQTMLWKARDLDT